ncbi:MAG: SurA N-terminal domain-containing protein [Candidatus Eisenbacteria bacterium]|uniref:Periplasmic chaperone PpiD n=1 Tax=Eiseniibacteriota bacterium TaxID=2212470 RepID=A0A956LYI4_UNCEI|nr:SurA N-terminal domain-containing protein [Candidatus Eisenbacteria bacterium]
MFDELRRSSKIFMWFMVVAFVGLIFLAWGADFQVGKKGGPTRTGEIGRVNGESISAQQYQQVVDNSLASFEQAGQPVSEQTAAMVRTQAWENLVQQTLLRQQADKMGISISDREVADAVLNQPLPEFRQHPAFQTNGQFDLSKYQATLRSPSFDTRSLEAQYRYTLPLQKLQQRVIGTVVVSDDDVWEDYRMRNDKMKVEYLLVNSGNYQIDAAGIPDDRLQSYYQEHRQSYELPPQAMVQYVLFPKKYTADDSLATYDLMSSLREDALAGDDFLSQITDMSEAPATQRGGENAAWISVNSLSPALRQVVPNLEPGTLSDVIVEPRGFHLVRVEEKKVDEAAGGDVQVRLADLFMSLKPSSGTLTEVANRARTFREDVGGGDLATAAEQNDVVVKETQPFQEQGLISGLGLAAEVQEFAFSHPVGAVSPPIERGDSWVIARVKERRDRRIPDFAEVQARVRNEVADADRRALAQAEAAKLLARLRGGESMEAVAASDPAVQHKTIDELTRTGTRDFGSDPDVVGPIFAHDVGLIDQPLVGRTGAYLVDVLEKKPADRATFDAQKAQLREGIRQQRENQLFAAWIENLRDRADITDFRSGAF